MIKHTSSGDWHNQYRTDRFNSKESSANKPYLEIQIDSFSGYLVSKPITPTSINSWNRFYATTTKPAGTSVTFSILDAATNTPLCTGLTGNGDDVSTCLSGKTSVKLRADMSTTNPPSTPAIGDWEITWYAGTPKNAYLNLLTYFYSDGTVSYSGSTAGKTITGISATPALGSVSVFANKFNNSFANFSADASAYVAFIVNRLKPNTNYTIKKDGLNMMSVQADSFGKIIFNNTVW